MRFSDVLKAKLRELFRNNSAEQQPMLPAGTVDTRAFHEELRRDLERLDSLFAEDPDAFRKMQLGSAYRKADSPDFDETIPAYMYKLRLSNLYSFLYYVMYHILITAISKTDTEEIKPLVLGCGSMIDALSLTHALKGFERNYHVQYTGVDISEWPFMYDASFDTRFVKKPLQDYWDDVDVFDGNVIFFATVISELSEYPDETAKFCQGLEETPFTRDTIYLMTSYRSMASYQKDWKLTDWQKVQRVIRAIERKGYRAECLPVTLPEGWETYVHSEYARDEQDRVWPCYYVASPYDEGGQIRIDALAPDFSIDDRVQEYLVRPGYIRKRCSYYQACREQYLKRYPEQATAKEVPLEVCKKVCPIQCKPGPRASVSNSYSPCFQLIVFHKK